MLFNVLKNFEIIIIQYLLIISGAIKLLFNSLDGKFVNLSV